jgi:hypothetical protein
MSRSTINAYPSVILRRLSHYTFSSDSPFDQHMSRAKETGQRDKNEKSSETSKFTRARGGATRQAIVLENEHTAESC